MNFLKIIFLCLTEFGTLIYDESKVSSDDDGIRNDGASLDDFDINVNFDEVDAFVMKRLQIIQYKYKFTKTKKVQR